MHKNNFPYINITRKLSLLKVLSCHEIFIFLKVIYVCPIFKWVAEAYLHDNIPVATFTNMV